MDNSFFTERTDLLWTSDGEKQVQLHRALAEGAIVFIRLLSGEPSNGSVPVAYQIEHVESMDRNGRCLVKLAQLHPRSKQSQTAQPASNWAEDGQSRCDAHDPSTELEFEEVLR